MKTILLNLFFVLAGIGLNAQVDLETGLIGHYPLDGNANDVSGNGNNMYTNNVVPTANHNGVSGKALFFNGNSSYCSMESWNYVAYNMPEEYTVSVWARMDQLSSAIQSIVSKEEYGGYGISFLGPLNQKYYFNSHIECLYLRADSKEIPTPGIWYHLVGTFMLKNNTMDIRLYINGELEDNYLMGGGIHITTPSYVPLAIGANPGDGYFTDYFNGAIDEVRIYNRALSDEEVEALFQLENSNNSISQSICEGESYEFAGQILTTSGVYFHTFTDQQGNDSVVALTLTVNPKYLIDFNYYLVTGNEYVFGDTVLTTEGTYQHTFKTVHGCDSIVTLHVKTTTYDFNAGLMAYYPLNGNAYDASINKKHLENFGAIPTNNYLGDSLKAMYFNGENSYLTCSFADEDYFDPENEFTLSAWIKPDNNTNYQAIICKEQSAGYGINFSQTYREFYFTSNIDGTYNTAYGLETPNIGEWYHLVGTFSHENGNTQIRLYCNGVFQNTYQLNGINYLNNSTVPLVLGANPDNNGGVSAFFKGSIDDVRIYNRALSSNEIISFYNLQFSKINEQKTNKLTEIEISPNPTNGIITIKSLEEIPIKEVIIYDINGRQLVNYQPKHMSKIVTLNLENLNGGIYNLKITTKIKVVFKKLIIEK